MTVWLALAVYWGVTHSPLRSHIVPAGHARSVVGLQLVHPPHWQDELHSSTRFPLQAFRVYGVQTPWLVQAPTPPDQVPLLVLQVSASVPQFPQEYMGAVPAQLQAVLHTHESEQVCIPPDVPHDLVAIGVHAP